MEYGLIGEKLGHSFSKIIHEKLASYIYKLKPLSNEEFHVFMKHKDFSGINVTIPYKSDVIPYLDELDDKAKEIGAVNTIVHKNNKLMGYNTDYYGFLYTLEENNIKVKDKKVIVLGTGGSAKSILAVLSHLNARSIVTVKQTATSGAITYEECYEKHSDAQILINTSPIGMYPNVDNSPIDLTHLPRLHAVVDIIYNPLKTKLLLQGEELGLITVNGLEMLVAQAVFAVEHFTGKEVKRDIIQKVYLEILAEMS